jgi:hypothetical protein
VECRAWLGGKSDHPSSSMIARDAIAEVPDPAMFESVEPEVWADTLVNVEVRIRALDRDRSKSGWAAVIPALGEGRVRLQILPGVDRSTLASREAVRGDLIVNYKRGANGEPRVVSASSPPAGRRRPGSRVVRFHVDDTPRYPTGRSLARRKSLIELAISRLCWLWTMMMADAPRRVSPPRADRPACGRPCRYWWSALVEGRGRSASKSLIYKEIC